MDPRSRIRHSPIGARLALLILVIAGSAAHGRIFESLGRAGSGSYASFPGWSQTYASPWVINGSRTDVEVWSISDSLSATLSRLRAEAKRQGDIASFFPGASLAWGVSSGHGQMTRFLCNALDGNRQTLVFRFSQSESDIKRSSGGPGALALPEGIPVMAGAKPEFVATSDESGTTLAIFTTPESAAQVRAFLDRALKQAGWLPALGPTAPPDSGLGFYLRGRSICGFTAKMSGHDGSCVVTVLHRRLKSGESN